jgi:hypothetical protein
MGTRPVWPWNRFALVQLIDKTQWTSHFSRGTTRTSTYAPRLSEIEIMNNEENYEIEGGSCPECGTQAQLRTCDDCGETAWIIDCGHMSQPRPIAGGRSDGSEGHRTFCTDCAEGGKA